MELVTNKKFNLGQYTTPFQKVNMLDAQRTAPLGIARNLFLREWQAFQIFTEGYFGIMAIYNTKKISLVQFILYDIVNKKKIRFEKKILPWQLSVPNGLYKTKAEHQSKGCSMLVEHDIDNHQLSIQVDIKKSRKHPAIKAQLNGYHNVDEYTPMVVCLPFSDTRAMYSHKCMMPLSGVIYLDDKKINFNTENSHLILDDHKGFYPYNTKYDWVTAAGIIDGKRVGFNFTDNQVINKEKYNENGIWTNGKLTFLPPIKVERPNGYKGDWFIKDKVGKVDLTFTPVEHHAVSMNIIILKSKYQGPYGYFNGSIQTADEKIVFKDLFGMGEDFFLRS